MNNVVGNYEVNALGNIDLRVPSADEWNSMQAYLQTQGHVKRIFAMFSEDEIGEEVQEMSTYEC